MRPVSAWLPEWVLPAVLWLLVLAGTAWLYLPGVDGPPMLDDRASVSVLAGLDQNPELAIDYIFGDRAGPLGRPVSMLTFVLEKLYLDEGIAGGKKVNIGIHLVNGCLVVWLFVLLLNHLQVPGQQWLAVLAGAAWLVSPLYVSTVLYVVQRMAMLATLFMLATCISYVYWRISLNRGGPRIAYLVGAFVFMALAVLSKENSIVILAIVLLMEYLWFGCAGQDGVQIPWLGRAVKGLIVAGAVFLILLFTFKFDQLASFTRMPFTLRERVLTEGWILWEYVGQLYFPDITVMGLYHDDVMVSRSLFENPRTAYAALAWLGIVLLSLLLLRRQWGRYCVFAFSFYLIGHSTESTILPLELYFEHRNYFPGIGLFLLVALLYAALAGKWPELKAPLLVYLALYVVYLATQAGSQVQIWSNVSLLRLNDVNAHPASFRANADMATEMAQMGALEAALAYSARAHEANSSEREGDRDIRDLALSCMSGKPLADDRLARIGTVQPERPLSSVATLNVLVGLLRENACPDFNRVAFADRMKEIFLIHGRSDKAAAQIYMRLAALENALERYDNANAYIEKYLELAPNDSAGLLMKLHFATALGLGEITREIKSKLQTMDEQGKLTIGERQTLSLYLEHELTR